MSCVLRTGLRTHARSHACTYTHKAAYTHYYTHTWGYDQSINLSLLSAFLQIIALKARQKLRFPHRLLPFRLMCGNKSRVVSLCQGNFMLFTTLMISGDADKWYLVYASMNVSTWAQVVQLSIVSANVLQQTATLAERLIKQAKILLQVLIVKFIFCVTRVWLFSMLQQKLQRSKQGISKNDYRWEK